MSRPAVTSAAPVRTNSGIDQREGVQAMEHGLAYQRHRQRSGHRQYEQGGKAQRDPHRHRQREQHQHQQQGAEHAPTELSRRKRLGDAHGRFQPTKARPARGARPALRPLTSFTIASVTRSKTSEKPNGTANSSHERDTRRPSMTEPKGSEVMKAFMEK